MNCSEANAFIHAYVDGELAGMDRDAYDRHLLVCDACSHACRLQSRFKAAVRGHCSRREVPERLRRRINDAIAIAPGIRSPRFWNAYPRLAPAAAAVVAMVTIFGVARTNRSPLVMEQALRTYHSAMPMDVVDSNCASIAKWFHGRVDFAIPPIGNQLGPCQGGRLINVQDRFGAYVVYTAPSGHRLDMMVFAGDDPDALDGGRRRVVVGRDVYFGSARGASTAAFRGRDGLTYVVTSDVDEDSLTTLVETALLRR
jgi:anti-sigma factor (TIGR02949 family)